MVLPLSQNFDFSEKRLLLDPFRRLIDHKKNQDGKNNSYARHNSPRILGVKILRKLKEDG
jgi:hypothetical protein